MLISKEMDLLPAIANSWANAKILLWKDADHDSQERGILKEHAFLNIFINNSKINK